MMGSTSRSKLKSGGRPGLVYQQRENINSTKSAAPNAVTAQKFDKIFKRGSLMFIEGEKGDNMFIIKKGKIKILKQEGSKTIQLAVLGPGSVIGEMSLLIDMPRSATAQVIEDVIALSIDKRILESTYSKIPPWLVSVIKVVVGRLRDTLKKNTDNLISDNINGVVNIVLLLAGDAVAAASGRVNIPMDIIKDEVLHAIGLSGGDTDKIITELILKDMVVIAKNKKGKEFLQIKQMDILEIYFEYLFTHYNGKTMAGETFTDKTIEFAKMVMEIGKDKGRKDPKGNLVITKPVLEVEMQRRGAGRFVDLDAIDELKEAQVIGVEEKSTKTTHISHKQQTFVLYEEQLSKALIVKEWLEVFREES